MHIAFVGGTRFIGHAAVALALERGHDVSVLHRGRHPSEIAAARPIAVDRADPSALSEVITRLAPDVVVDTRAMTRVDAESTALALGIARIHAVVLSSEDVYAQFGRMNGLPAPEPEPIVTEGSPLTIPYPFRGILDHPGGPDYDKKDVEAVFEAATQKGIPGVVILRLPAVYGARDTQRRFGEIVDALDRGERRIRCKGGASWRWTHAHVRDVAHAIVLAAEARTKGVRVFNVGEAETPPMRTRVEAIARSMGIEIEWEEVVDLPDTQDWLGEMPNDFIASSDRLRAELSFTEITTEAERITDLVTGLRDSRARG